MIAFIGNAGALFALLLTMYMLAKVREKGEM